MNDEIDELFSSDPSTFTAERDALAARLRADGDKEEAARVKALRRPTTAAWAVNQVARRHPEMVEEVRSAGQELERAQRRMMSGLRDVDLPGATRRRRAAVDAAVEAAAGFLSELGSRPDPHVDKLRATFEAASLGGQDGDAVRAGRLSKELPPPSGFGGVQGLELLTGDVDGAAAPPRAGHDRETPSGEDTAADGVSRRAPQGGRTGDRRGGRPRGRATPGGGRAPPRGGSSRGRGGPPLIR
jgi:hypothetical protein